MKTRFVLLVSLLSISSLAISQQSFMPHNITRGSSPRTITLADIDGDSDLDLLAVYFEDNLVAWYRNDGGGYFDSLIIINDKEKNMSGIFAADLNDDGNIDVITGGLNNVSWFKNNGNGSFGPAQIISNNVNLVSSVFAVDIDNDSLIDIVSGTSGDHKIAWYKNNGNGTFGSQQIISTNVISVYSIYAEDLDLDGKTDILSASYDDNKIAWYKNLGGGNFGTQQIITNTAEGAFGVMAADLDNDNMPDIITSHALGLNDKLTWHKNLGNGNFSTEIIINDSIVIPRYFFTADLDNDNDLDIILTIFYQDSLVWHENLGNGNFGPQQLISDNIGGPFGVYAGDLNGDGVIDIVAGSEQTASIEVYINHSFGNILLNQIIANAAVDVRSVYADDIDNDGKTDILSASIRDNKIAWYKNLGNKEYTLQKVISDTVYGANSIISSELDNDGYNDLISVGRWDSITWYKNPGNGSFNIAQNIPGYYMTPLKAIAKDLDNDGLKDIIALTNYSIIWSKNLGNGGFGATQFLYSLLGINTFDVADINNDGYLDIVFGSGFVLSLGINDGTGNFLPVQYVNQTIGAIGLQLADLNNDGFIDILYTTLDNSTYISFVGWYQNDGFGNFNTPVIISNIDDFSYTVNASDIDNDGDLDIFSAPWGTNNTIGNLVWFENLGSGNFSQLQNVDFIGGMIFDMYLTDLDNDYDKDIVLAINCFSNVKWLENTLYNLQTTYSICEGDSIEINGNWYSSDATFYDSLQNYLGGDSIIVTVLNVHALPIILIEAFAPDSILVNAGPRNLPNATPVGGVFSGIGVSDSIFDPAISGIGNFWITYTYTDSITNCSGSDSTQVIVFDETKIENLKIEQFSIFPNPTYGKFTIEGKNLQSIEIRNISGKIVYLSDNLKSSDKFQINLKNKAKGIYFIKITCKNFIDFRKLVLI